MNKNYFDFLYIIGRGGFGKVWKVRLKKTSEYFALKEMSKMKIIDRRSELSIMSERALLSKLNNPFIVNMYFTFQDFSNLYLVMDLLTGGDLRYHIAKKKRFSERETKFFIANMLLALEYIHSKNIIHRDIKPENLVLELNGYLRITDFGVAKINEKDNSSETSGTPGYMAPEVILVQNHSFPSDFFALGVIGYEFMLGYRPYLGGSRKEIKELIIYKQARLDEGDIPYSWSLEAGDFINKLLKRKPTKRLGYNGIKEIKNHIWMKDINWDLLKKKELIAPFIPNPNKENFDKAYCERVEEIGETTIERYQEYAESELFQEVFEGYTYINVEYLKSKSSQKKEKSERKKKKKEDSKKNIRIESVSSRIKKNYTLNLTNQKKSISISQENLLNNSRKHNRLKINLRKRNQNSNKNMKQIYPTPKKQTIDVENKKEVLKRMSVNDNIKTNKNYLSIDNKKEIDMKLKYDKEKLRKRALKISSKMKEINDKNEFNININLKNKKLINKRFILNKSNSMKILNSLNKENININLSKKNTIRNEGKISSKNIKSNSYKNRRKNEKENKNQVIYDEKKKTYQKYNISLNFKDKQIKNDDTIHKRTYDIKKKKNCRMKNNISEKKKINEIKVKIKEEKKLKQKTQIKIYSQMKENVQIKDNQKKENAKNVPIKEKEDKIKVKEIAPNIIAKSINHEIKKKDNESIKEIKPQKENIIKNKNIEIKNNKEKINKKSNLNKVEEHNNKNEELEKKVEEHNNKSKELEKNKEKEKNEIKNKELINENNKLVSKLPENNGKKVINNNIGNAITKKDLDLNKNENIELEEINDSPKRPKSKIMLWIQRSLPINYNENKKFSTIDNNIYKNINRNDNTININKSMSNPEKNKAENQKTKLEPKDEEKKDEISERKIEANIIEKKSNNKNENNINKEINETPHEFENISKNNYKTIIIDANNKYKSNKIFKKKYNKSSNNTKKSNFAKNISCPNIYYDRQNIITKEVKTKTPKNTFVVFNTININLGNTGKNFKRNKTPKIQVMKNINSSLKNIYLSNEFYLEPAKLNTYLDRKIMAKSKGHFTTKKNNNTSKDKKSKEFKKRNINKNSNLYSEYIKSI